MGIFNLLSVSEYVAGQKQQRKEIRMAISEEVKAATQGLREDVEALLARVDATVEPLTVANTELTAALAAERELARSKAVEEDAEDVEQNAELDSEREAREAAEARTDEALASQEAAVADIAAVRETVQAALVTATEVIEDESPAAEEPVAEPAAEDNVEGTVEVPEAEDTVVEEPEDDEVAVGTPEVPVDESAEEVEVPTGDVESDEPTPPAPAGPAFL